MMASLSLTGSNLRLLLINHFLISLYLSFQLSVLLFQLWSEDCVLNLRILHTVDVSLHHRTFSLYFTLDDVLIDWVDPLVGGARMQGSCVHLIEALLAYIPLEKRVIVMIKHKILARLIWAALNDTGELPLGHDISHVKLFLDLFLHTLILLFQSSYLQLPLLEPSFYIFDFVLYQLIALDSKSMMLCEWAWQDRLVSEL